MIGVELSTANCYFSEGCTEGGLSYLRQCITGAIVSLVCGDFNARHADWDVVTNESGTVLHEWAAINNFSLVWSEAVAGPTFAMLRDAGSRTSHPDLVFCSDPAFIRSISKTNFDMCPSSDHTPLSYEVLMDKGLCREIVFVNYRKAADAFGAASSTDSPDLIMETLEKSLRTAQFRITKRTCSRIPQWWTMACSEAEKSRKALRRRLERSFSATIYKAYRLACSNFRHTVARAKREQVQRAFSCAKSGSRDFYRLVQSHRSPSCSSIITSFMSPDLEVEQLASELEERWNGVELAATPPNNDAPPVFSEADILAAIHSLKNSTPGEDNLSRKGLLGIFTANPTPIVSLINRSFSDHYHHPTWNTANIIMIPKKDGSNRPISVTNCLAKRGRNRG